MTSRDVTRRTVLTQAGAAGLMLWAAPARAQHWTPTTLDLPETGEVDIFVSGQPGMLRRLSRTERDRFLNADVVTSKPMHRDRNLRAAPAVATAQNILQGPDQDLLTLVLTCPHLGCVVMHDAGDFADEGGFFCPCYGTHFDGLGRMRSGPAPRNLYTPEWTFLAGDRVEIRMPSISSQRQ